MGSQGSVLEPKIPEGIFKIYYINGQVEDLYFIDFD